MAALQLCLKSIDVVEVDVGVPHDVGEAAGDEFANVVQACG